MPDLLNHFARIGAASIHPCGRKATGALTQHLALKPGYRVLEVGCGSGETSLRLCSQLNIDYVAVDRSMAMLRSAVSRLRYVGIEDRATHVITDCAMPFEDEFFDAALAESVLGINTGAAIAKMLEEIHRVLRFGGIFVANEAVWRPGTPPAIIERINSSCLEDFGLIQSTGDLVDRNSWTTAFSNAGFDVKSTSVLDEISNREAGEPKHHTPAENASRRFTAREKIRSLVRPSTAIRHLRIWHLMRKHRLDGHHIEGRLFVAVKKCRDR